MPHHNVCQPRRKSRLIEALPRASLLERMISSKKGAFAQLFDGEDAVDFSAFDRVAPADQRLSTSGALSAGDGVNSVMRENAVKPERTAPATANDICQPPGDMLRQASENAT